MPITINGTGTITGLSAGGLPNDSVTSANIASLAATKLTGTLPDANAPSGSVIQVVQFTTNGGGTYSTNDWAEMMNLSITPSSTSSRILIQYQLGIGGSANDPFSARIRRGTTVVGSNTNSGGNARYANASAGMFSGYSDFDRVHMIAGHFLDSPNTTSNVLYRIEVSPRTDSGNRSWRLGAPWNDVTDGYIHKVNNIITLMEIAG